MPANFFVGMRMMQLYGLGVTSPMLANG